MSAISWKEPYDAEVEYLESTGAQYIDTGVYGGSDTKVEILASSANTSSNMALVGARTGTLNSFTVWQRASATQIRFDYTVSVANLVTVPNGWDTAGTNYLVKDGARNFVNGVEQTANATVTFLCEHPFYLFAVNTSGTAGSFFAGRIYSCKIYAGSILVRDFVPVRVGSVGMMYDRVTKRLFGNAGTGSFTIGPDIVRVEYIESSGTQYIDTGWNLDTGTDTVQEDIMFLPDDSSGYKYYFGVYGVPTGESANTYYVLSKNNNVNNISIGIPSTAASGGTNINIGMIDGLWHIVQVGPSGIFYDGVNKTGSVEQRTVSFGAPLGLFAGTYAGDGRPRNLSKARMGHITIVRSGVLVRDYQPIRIGSGSSFEGAMMDTITRKVYRNAGTGSFAYGPDKVERPSFTLGRIGARPTMKPKVPFIRITPTQTAVHYSPFDTGVTYKGTDHIRIELEWRIVAGTVIGTWGSLFGNSPPNYFTGFMLRHNNNYDQGIGQAPLSTSTTSTGSATRNITGDAISWSKVVFDSGAPTGRVITRNGNTCTYENQFFDAERWTSTTSIYIGEGARGYGATVATDWHRVTMWKNGELIRDYVPHADGCFFDLVSQTKLERNSSSSTTAVYMIE